MTSTLTFQWPWLFLLLPLPWLVSRFLPPAEGGGALRAPFFQHLAELTGEGALASRQTPGRLPLLALLAWLLLVTASAQPQWVDAEHDRPVSGRDLMLAVDISQSMVIPDFVLSGRHVDRLVAIKDVAGRFIRRRAGDRLGLILFGRNAYLQTPLTFDAETVAAMLEEAEIGMAGRETAIGDAIGLAIKRFHGHPGESRVIVLLSDGQNTAGAVEPRQAAQLAAREGVRIHTIGVGSREAFMLKTDRGLQRIDPDAELDEKTLTAMAEVTGGSYFRAADLDGLEEIYARIDDLEPTVAGAEPLLQRRSLYPWLLAPALLIVLWLARPPGLAWPRRREKAA